MQDMATATTTAPTKNLAFDRAKAVVSSAMPTLTAATVSGELMSCVLIAVRRTVVVFQTSHELDNRDTLSKIASTYVRLDWSFEAFFI